MEKIPTALLPSFKSLLVSKNIPEGYHAYYLKWLRYYLDFCHKYGFNESNPQSLPDFIGKLKEKKQTAAQQKQADSAIRIYYESIQPEYEDFRKKSTPKSQSPIIVKENQKSFRAPSSKGKLLPSSSKLDSAPKSAVHKRTNEKWNAALSNLANEIKVRHYSPKTLKSYSTWVRKLQHFCKGKDPAELSSSDVKEFLTFLAIKQKVSSSSQNQAFNALLFLFRHILKKVRRGGRILNINYFLLNSIYSPSQSAISPARLAIESVAGRFNFCCDVFRYGSLYHLKGRATRKQQLFVCYQK
jgi:hypothetical protein